MCTHKPSAAACGSHMFDDRAADIARIGRYLVKKLTFQTWRRNPRKQARIRRSHPRSTVFLLSLTGAFLGFFNIGFALRQTRRFHQVWTRHQRRPDSDRLTPSLFWMFHQHVRGMCEGWNWWNLVPPLRGLVILGFHQFHLAVPPLRGLVIFRFHLFHLKTVSNSVF